MNAKCDYCDQRATTLAGDTNGVLVCEDHVRLFAERSERHHPRCYQSTGVPEGLPAGLCDCRVLQALDAAAVICPWCKATGGDSCRTIPATPDAGDVEALGKVLGDAFRAKRYGGGPEVEAGLAAAVLASDWLASHVAATADRVRREAVAHERMQQADRLQNAIGALDSLKHQTERIAGKRQGVALALSYIEEDQRIAREAGR